MIDKPTFIIVMIKLLGIQVILTGLVFACLTAQSYYVIFITLGSLIFAVGSNCLLAHVLYVRHKTKGAMLYERRKESR